jgi:hypothetical protein
MYLRFTLLVMALIGATVLAAPPMEYQKKANRNETIRATLKANGYPNLEGVWHIIGPFDNPAENEGFSKVYPPEKEIDLSKSYEGKEGKVAWKELPQAPIGKIVNLAAFTKKSDHTVMYLTHEIENKLSEPILMPLMVGSDDSIVIWLNGEKILSEEAVRAAAPDQNTCEMKLKPGKNRLLVKVTNIAGGFEVYLHPELSKDFPQVVKNQLNRDFPSAQPKSSAANSSAESKFYKIITLKQPDDCILEVGGLAFRPDGKLLACTRRGEVWLIDDPLNPDVEKMKWSKFASGLHEALGLYAEDNNTVYVIQRPELTKMIDKNGDGKADVFQTICDKWGNAGDYHEYAFGPARDKEGNFFITLNVGFGGGHQGKSPFRGWCVKVTPKGDMEPYAYGLRSPNGINFSPEGELFYCDNQGEWVASNKMHHIQKGDFYGHQASLPWLKHTPFYDPKKKNDIVPSNLMYDGSKSSTGKEGFPELTPPCIWFPYGRMGQSASEPRWDTTGGKFGPFAGQCFVGDQTKSIIMRVALEKVEGKYQGACFPFRSGFQCGVNRILFAPDGSLFVGQTARGWGSVGGKQQGMERLVWTGEVPFEMYDIKLEPNGFQIRFTKPIDPELAKKIEAYSVRSYTYEYSSNYGCPEKDTRPEKVNSVKLDADGQTVHIEVPNLRKGRVYDIHLEGIKSKEGEGLLHSDGYYTLNYLKK